MKLAITGAHAGEQTAVADTSGYTGFTYPDTKTVTHFYDSLSARLITTDQESRTTTWAYDGMSRLKQVTDALS